MALSLFVRRRTTTFCFDDVGDAHRIEIARHEQCFSVETLYLPVLQYHVFRHLLRADEAHEIQLQEG